MGLLENYWRFAKSKQFKFNKRSIYKKFNIESVFIWKIYRLSLTVTLLICTFLNLFHHVIGGTGRKWHVIWKIENFGTRNRLLLIPFLTIEFTCNCHCWSPCRIVLRSQNFTNIDKVKEKIDKARPRWETMKSIIRNGKQKAQLHICNSWAKVNFSDLSDL